MGVNVIVSVACLGALWVAALLVAASALHDWRELRSTWAQERSRPPRDDTAENFALYACEVISGQGEEGVFAAHEVAQIGRALDGDSRTIAFRDVSHRSVVYGGVVRIGSETFQVPEELVRASVWPSQDRGHAPPNDREFDAAWTAACAPKGHPRSIKTTIEPGDRVFIRGVLSRHGEGGALVAPEGASIVVALDDPRTFVSRKSAAILSFVVAELLTCLSFTIVATWPPAFGRVSTVGAVLCLAFFLGVTPVGVWVRDRSLPPNRAPRNGAWKAASQR